MTDDEIPVEFEHRTGMQKGAVSLPSGLRDKAEIVDGTFTVDFPAAESLISNPTFRALVEAGHTPLDLPDEQADTVQRRLGDTGDGDDTSGDADGDSDGADADSDDASEPDELDDMDRSELYEHAHKLDAVPEEEIPEWNESSAGGLRELIREYEG